MGHAFIDETLADVLVGRRFYCAIVRIGGEFCLLDLSLRAVGKQIIGITGTHDTSASQRQRHSGRIYGDPATPPLLGDKGSRSGAASWIEDEVAGVGCHEDAALSNSRIGLNNIDDILSPHDVRPQIGELGYWMIVQKPDEPRCVSTCVDSTCSTNTHHVGQSC